MSKYYPVFLDLRGKRCLVVGGGQVAERKVQSLLDCGARVFVVSPRLTPGLMGFHASGTIQAAVREYMTEDIAGAFLVIAATDDRELNAAVSGQAVASRCLVNVVDDPENSNFIVPSVVHRGDVAVAVSTGGKSPALAKKLRLALEDVLPTELSMLADLVSEARQELKRDGVRPGAQAWLDALHLEPLIDLLRRGQANEAKQLILGALRRSGAAGAEKRG